MGQEHLGEGWLAEVGTTERGVCLEARQSLLETPPKDRESGDNTWILPYPLCPPVPVCGFHLRRGA